MLGKIQISELQPSLIGKTDMLRPRLPDIADLTEGCLWRKRNRTISQRDLNPIAERVP